MARIKRGVTAKARHKKVLALAKGQMRAKDEENAKLREENTRLLQWQNVARKLEAGFVTGQVVPVNGGFVFN